MDLKVHSQFVAGIIPQRILRARNVRTARRAVARDRNTNPAFAKFVAARSSGAQTESSLAAFQIRYTHAGKQYARKFFRWKSHRHANHGTENTSFAQPVPERRAAAHAFNPWAAKWNIVFANLPAVLRSLNLRRGKVGQIVAEIAGKKIVDVVLAGVYAGHERRPRHRRNRRECGLQFAECSSLTQLREIRQLAFGNESFRQFWIHPVEAKNDSALDLCFPVSLSWRSRRNNWRKGQAKKAYT